MTPTQAWWWVDTHGDITSKLTLIRFGPGTLSDGATETRFAYGEALIDEPTHQRYETHSGPRIGPADAPTRVNITLHGAGQAPESALINRSVCSLAAADFSVPRMFLSELTASAMWAARAVAEEASVGVMAKLGRPPGARVDSGAETAPPAHEDGR